MPPSSHSLFEVWSPIQKKIKNETPKILPCPRHQVVRPSLLVYFDRHEAHDDSTSAATTSSTPQAKAHHVRRSMGRVDQAQRRARSPQRRAPRQRRGRAHPLRKFGHFFSFAIHCAAMTVHAYCDCFAEGMASAISMDEIK